jgi:hypothetical protein
MPATVIGGREVRRSEVAVCDLTDLADGGGGAGAAAAGGSQKPAWEVVKKPVIELA